MKWKWGLLLTDLTKPIDGRKGKIMSLDVSLYGKEEDAKCCHCGSTYKEENELYSANITHNLNTMADKAGLYELLWRPEDRGYTKAKDLIEGLKLGLTDLKSRPEYFEQFNSKNGWGMYEHFVPFVEKYLEACVESPEATIRVSR